MGIRDSISWTSSPINHVKDDYHLGLDQLVLFGDSAGAHVAAQGALFTTNSEYEKAIGVESVINKDQFKRSVLYCEPYDISKVLNIGNKKLISSHQELLRR